MFGLEGWTYFTIALTIYAVIGIAGIVWLLRAPYKSE